MFLFCGFFFVFYSLPWGSTGVISFACVASATIHKLTTASLNSPAQNFVLKLINSFGCTKVSKTHCIQNETWLFFQIIANGITIHPLSYAKHLGVMFCQFFLLNLPDLWPVLCVTMSLFPAGIVVVSYQVISLPSPVLF